MAMIFAIVACLISLTTATALEDTSFPSQPQETLLVDLRTPVRQKGHWVMMSNEEHELLRRASNSGTTLVTTTIEIAVSTATAQPTTTTVAASPLPSPFDSALASNFSGNGGNGACPAFINKMLTDSTFKQCYPFSVLLQGSRSFFEAEKSLVSITQVLDASCAANSTFCQSYLSGLASNLTKSENCGDDYSLGNSVVVQAYEGLLSYQPIYSAACLKDPDTSAYCFANAITNLTNPSNVYFYYLPLNNTLPGGSTPSCNWCTQQTMGIYQSASANRKSFIANQYLSAATQVNTICGPDFVNDTLPAAAVASSGVSTPQHSSSLLLVSFIAMALSHWFL